MKYFFLSLAFLVVSTPISAQLVEHFDSPVKGSYAPATVNLPSGPWYLADALMGNLDADHRIGSYSVRVRNAGSGNDAPRIQMQFDVDGAGQVSFWYGTYITDGNFGRHSEIQLQKSTNGGFQWDNIGDPLTTTSVFTQAVYDVDIDSAVRFRIIKTGGNSTQHRINIDEFRVTEYIDPINGKALSLMIDDTTVNLENELSINFPVSVINSSNRIPLKFLSTGTENVTGSISLSGSDIFSIAGQQTFDLAFRESHQVEIIASSNEQGAYQGTLTINSDADGFPEITIQLFSEFTGSDNIIPIYDARNLPFGTIVTVAGFVTTANEFGGPIFIQDNTAGIAVFHPPLHTDVQRGDSVVVTGPITEFNPTGSNQGTFLRQISGNDILYSVYPENNRLITPRNITLSEMNSGCCESQLVRVDDATFNDRGFFPSNTRNYTISQNGVNGVLRIDTRSNFSGSAIPEEPITILGVVDRFSGTYQLKPRDLDDLGVEELENPFAHIPKNETFDVATWNVEWFGHPSNGPTDIELQFRNVRRVIETMDMDLYALQEIANETMFRRLVDSLANYNGFIAQYAQTQRVAYLYKTSTIDSVASGFVAQNSSWANGRFPFMFLFDATVNGETRRIRSINFHAKAFATQSDYNQRVQDAIALKAYTDSRNAHDKLIILGDYNDDVILSTWNDMITPYQAFNDDPDYHIVTRSLSEMGFTSYRSVSMIDHIMINHLLFDYHLYGAEQVENTGYIGSYLSTTSDHYPVWTRFQFRSSTSISEDSIDLPTMVSLFQNYPNPFNPSTNISFSLPVADQISLEVFDTTGRKVATLISQEYFPQGTHSVSFDATSLSSGVYIYTLRTTTGFTLSNKMVLIK